MVGKWPARDRNYLNRQAINRTVGELLDYLDSATSAIEEGRSESAKAMVSQAATMANHLGEVAKGAVDEMRKLVNP